MIKRTLSLLLLATAASPAHADMDNGTICRAISGKQGVYLVRSTESISKLPVTQKLAQQADIRIYVIPPASQGDEETVVHLRVTNKAIRKEDNGTSRIRVKRSDVNSDCAQSKLQFFNRGKKSAFDNDREDADPQIADYNEFPKGEARHDTRLKDWHFRWNAGMRKENCQYTADHVPKIDGTFTREKDERLVHVLDSAEAVAATPKYDAASLTSVLVHQRKGTKGCFYFRPFNKRGARWTPDTSRVQAWTFHEGEKPRFFGDHLLNWDSK